MRVSKNQLTLLAGAVAAALATSASAQLILSPAPISGVRVYARELAAPVALPASAATQVNSELGVGISATQRVWLRYRTTGATFTAAVLAGNLVAATFSNIVVADGGAVGTSGVIFETTSNTGSPVTAPLVFSLPALTVASTGTNVTVTYDVHQTLFDAQNGLNVLYTRTGTLASFSNALVLSALGNVGAATAGTQTSTASAASSYLNFSAGAFETATRARVARMTLGINPVATGGCIGVPCLADGVTAATVGAIVNGASTLNSLAIAGDFGAATIVATQTATEVGTFTATSATVPLLAGTIGATSFVAAAAAAAGGATATNANELLVRYTVNGTTPLPISAYITTLTYVPLAGYTATPLTATTGQINRDGLTLESPWVTATTGFISRFFITQTTAANVPFTATVRNAAGLVTGGTLTGTLGPNRQTLITLASLLPADTTAFPGPYQVTFAIAATAAQTRGAYALTSPNGAVAIQSLYTAALQ